MERYFYQGTVMEWLKTILIMFLYKKSVQFGPIPFRSFDRSVRFRQLPLPVLYCSVQFCTARLYRKVKTAKGYQLQGDGAPFV